MVDIDDLLARLEAEGCDRGRYDREAAAVIRELMAPTTGAPTLVERVARAMAESDNCYYFAQTDNPRDEHWRLARTQLAAMPGGGPGAWVPADHLAEANREIARLREVLGMIEATGERV